MAHAPASDQLALLDVAELDQRIARLERDDAKHPLRKELGALLNATAAKARDRESAENALAQARRALAEAEKVSGGYQEQIADKEAKLNAGAGLTSRDLLVLQDEIRGLRDLLSAASEAEFSFLEAVERAEDGVEELAGQIEALKDKILGERTRLEGEVAEIHAERDRLRREREALVEPLAEDLKRLYEHARSTGGYAVMGMHPNGKTGAGITLSPVEVAQIKATPPDEIYLSQDYDCIVVRLES